MLFRSGGLISRMTRDTDNLYFFAVDGIAEITINTLMLIGIGIALFIIQPKLALYVLIPAPVIATMTYTFFRRIRRLYHRLWHRWAKMSATIGEAVNIMIEREFRHIPITEDGGEKPVAVFSIKDVIDLLAQSFPAHVLNLPPRPHQEMSTREGA